ncbi:MAG: DUF3526 domain-containing protein [Bacteroidota bacterium]
MLSYNFKYEFKLLLRSKWIQLLSVVLLLLFGFATYNGLQTVQKRKKDITAARIEMKTSDTMMLKLLDSVEQGLAVSVPRWTIPSSPMAVGNYHPRVAAMDAEPTAFIATGQADLFTHFVRPKVSGDDFALNFAEMTSPVQLLFGSFDLAFVIVYLLPLLIIAFSYNVLSAEKESGSLRLLAAQPLRLQTWVLQKLGLRFFWLILLVLVSMIVIFALAGINPLNQGVNFFGLFGLTTVYALFWFALAFLVNLWIGGSAKNAVALLGLWIVFVLLAPSVLNQLGNALYPMPSRTLMINEMRELKTEMAEKQDEILNNFLRDHPEYALNDTTQSRGFYHRYMASQKLIREELAPLVNAYEDQLKKQQNWINSFKWVSPAIIAQESLNRMAGTSTQDYENFRAQVVAFAADWRNHLIPLLFNNEKFTTDDVAGLPKFIFQPLQKGTPKEIIVLLVLALAILAFGFTFKTQTSTYKMLKSE